MCTVFVCMHVCVCDCMQRCEKGNHSIKYALRFSQKKIKEIMCMCVFFYLRIFLLLTANQKGNEREIKWETTCIDLVSFYNGCNQMNVQQKWKKNPQNSICFQFFYFLPLLSPATWLLLFSYTFTQTHTHSHTHTLSGNLYNLKLFFLFLLFVFSCFIECTISAKLATPICQP